MWERYSEEEIMKIIQKKRDTSIKNGTNLNHIKSGNAYSRTVSGKRKDLGDQFFRSKTEANYARYLKFVNEKYEYETREFCFEKIKRGTRYYIIDFYLPNRDQHVEIKGWLDSKSITKLKRFKKYYPKEFNKLIIVKQSLNDKDMAKLLDIGFKHNQIQNFKEIKSIAGLIKNWEY